MKTKDTGGRAFPKSNDSNAESTQGMSLRDYFAAKAMQSMIEKCGPYDPVKEIKTHKSVAEIAYQFADAMLEARQE